MHCLLENLICSWHLSHFLPSHLGLAKPTPDLYQSVSSILFTVWFNLRKGKDKHRLLNSNFQQNIREYLTYHLIINPRNPNIIFYRNSDLQMNSLQSVKDKNLVFNALRIPSSNFLCIRRGLNFKKSQCNKYPLRIHYRQGILIEDAVN